MDREQKVDILEAQRLEKSGKIPLLCDICLRMVGATRDEMDSGMCNGLVRIHNYRCIDRGSVRCRCLFWACEGECSKERNKIEEQRRLDDDKEILENYHEAIKHEEEEEKRKPSLKEYVELIRGIRKTRPTKDIPFEEYYQDIVQSRIDYDRHMDNLVVAMAPLKPKDMTDEEWEIKKRRLDKADRERMKQNKIDRKLRQTVTPSAILEDNIDEIGCRCTAEELRQNKFCNTCTLLARVNEYLLRLFKDTAEAMK